MSNEKRDGAKRIVKEVPPEASEAFADRIPWDYEVASAPSPDEVERVARAIFAHRIAFLKASKAFFEGDDEKNSFSDDELGEARAAIAAMNRAPQPTSEITDAHIGAALQGAIYPLGLAAAGKIVRNRLHDHCGAYIVGSPLTYNDGLRRAAEIARTLKTLEAYLPGIEGGMHVTIHGKKIAEVIEAELTTAPQLSREEDIMNTKMLSVLENAFVEGGLWAEQYLAWNEGCSSRDLKEALQKHQDMLLTTAPSQPSREEMLAVLKEIATERTRQIEAEGWTPEHDDAHTHGEIARAAACYTLGYIYNFRSLWPWDWKWWKRKERRRELVIAGALIIAEIERLDRARAIIAKAENAGKPELEADAVIAAVGAKYRDIMIDAERVLSLVICPSDPHTHHADLEECAAVLDKIRALPEFSSDKPSREEMLVVLKEMVELEHERLTNSPMFAQRSVASIITILDRARAIIAKAENAGKPE